MTWWHCTGMAGGTPHALSVIPAKAGIQIFAAVDSRLRGNGVVVLRGNDGMMLCGNDGMMLCGNDVVVLHGNEFQ